MSRTLLRRMAAPAVGTAVTLTLGLAPAQAGTPGWQVVKTVGPRSGVTSILDDDSGDNNAEGFVATGASDAWSVWGACRRPPCGGSRGFIVEHWAGSAWQRVPSASLPGLTSPDAVTASSSTDAWLFNGSLSSGSALHWNGTGWTSQSLPSWVLRFNESGDVSISAPDFGPSDLWVFSLGQEGLGKQKPYAGRFNGHRWSKAHLPAVPVQVSAVSKDDIWALGTPDNPGPTEVLMHWDGHAWSTLAAPAPTVPPGGSVFFYDPVASGPANLWLTQTLTKRRNGPATTSLEHWNGTAWQPVPLHYPTSSVGEVAGDGSGGLWLLFAGPRPGFRLYFGHLTASGAWSRQAVPPATGTTVQQVRVITAIPGTTSAWAAGGVIVPNEGSGGVVGAIWRR
jgi:hypothetical protein